MSGGLDGYSAQVRALKQARADAEARDAGGLFASPPTKLGRTFSELLDGLRLANATARVLALMLDGEWHTTEELRAVGGSSGDRRARQLRDPEWGSFTVDAERMHGGVWRYRLVNPDPAAVTVVVERIEKRRSAA